jgi:hypothetical protein
MEYWKVNLRGAPAACMCTRNKLNRIYNNEEDARQRQPSMRSQNTSAFILRRCQPINSRPSIRSSALFSGRERHLRNDETRRPNGKIICARWKNCWCASSHGSPKKKELELCTQWKSAESASCYVQPSVSPEENRRGGN